MHTVQVSAVVVDPLGSDVIAVPEGGTVDLDLRLEAVSEGVLVTGTANAEAVGECVRCLRQVRENVSVDLTELFAYTERSRAEDDDDGDEALPVMDGDLIDLETTVTDALVPALPFRPLCSPDCQGLCSECGVLLEEAEPDHSHEILDPRWAALAGLVVQEPDEGDEDVSRG